MTDNMADWLLDKWSRRVVKKNNTHYFESFENHCEHKPKISLYLPHGEYIEKKRGN